LGKKSYSNKEKLSFVFLRGFFALSLYQYYSPAATFTAANSRPQFYEIIEKTLCTMMRKKVEKYLLKTKPFSIF